ncbi:hypothetical protein BG004_005663 [Podila humilis]|nr:hypothetical protein BG004_005663 [Podila humilis]
MNSPKDHNGGGGSGGGQQHSVIDTLHETRQEHNQLPYPHPAPALHVHDEILDTSSPPPHPLLGLNTTANLSSTGWQPLVTMSTNLASSPDTAASATLIASHEILEHDKPSVLPEILPTFRGRMADIHHATLSSVSGSGHQEKDKGMDEHQIAARNKTAEATYWTAGTMFPVMMPTSSPSSLSTTSPKNNNNNNDSIKAVKKNDIINKPTFLSKSSILYESDSGTGPAGAHNKPTATTTATTTTTSMEPGQDNNNQQQQQQHHSSTFVQGGQGGRRWSHELSPEKAGLVGSVLEAAGLIKDVVLDKIQQHPPLSSSRRRHSSSLSSKNTPSSTVGGGGSSTATNSLLMLSEQDKEEAARLAFGGTEETGDQALYLEGLQERYGGRLSLSTHQSPQPQSLSPKQQQQKGPLHVDRDAVRHLTSTSTNHESAAATATVSNLLKAAPPTLAREHHKSVFHLSGNPETMKSMLLDHPEQLGYHARDPTLSADLESPLSLQHRRLSVSSSSAGAGGSGGGSVHAKENGQQ